MAALILTGLGYASLQQEEAGSSADGALLIRNQNVDSATTTSSQKKADYEKRSLRTLQEKELSKSQLFPTWLQNVIKQAPKQKDTISFQLFDLSRNSVPEPPPPFFYAIEDTLHSAKFVVENEMHVVKSWFTDLRQAQRTNQENNTSISGPSKKKKTLVPMVDFLH
jgi:hypothetical protein